MTGLRSLEERDRKPLLAWRNSPAITRWMYGAHTITAAEHDRWFERAMVDSTDHRHRIVDDAGAPRAVVSLTAIDPARRSCTWGGYVVPGDEGQGHGTTALVLSLDLAFEQLDLNRVWIEALADNERAIHLYERIGFRREALLREYVWKDGAPRDVVGLAMLRSDWSADRSAIMEQVARRDTR